jgi:hypothetical protein
MELCGRRLPVANALAYFMTDMHKRKEVWRRYQTLQLISQRTRKNSKKKKKSNM